MGYNILNNLISNHNYQGKTTYIIFSLSYLKRNENNSIKNYRNISLSIDKIHWKNIRFELEYNYWGGVSLELKFLFLRFNLSI